MLAQCEPEMRKNISYRCTAMTHCVLLLIEKFGNRSAARKQEERVVPEATASSLAIKDSTADHSLAGPNDPFRSGDGDGANKTRLSAIWRNVLERG